jgi:hypothetical protein
MIKNTVIVLAFEGAKGTVERHRKYWEAQGDVVYVCGQGDALQGEYGLQWVYGPAEHHGFASNRKVLLALKQAIQGFPTNVLLMEHDAFILKPFKEWGHAIPTDAIWCPSFSDTRPNRGFVGTRFCHPPIIMNHRMACRLVSAMEALGPACEDGFFDRYIGLACDQHGIKVQDMWAEGLCYARNPIEGHYLDEACEAVKKSAIFIHGIHTEDNLRRIEASIP